MRKLFILRGIMASGKSTFIKENNLEDYTLSPDKIRLLFNSPEMTITYGETIPQHNNKNVWKMLFYLLEERMKKGELTIIDATHIYDDNLKKYKKLAEKYRYRLYIIDFTDISLDEALKRNKMRVAKKIVPEETIKRVYDDLKKIDIPKAFKIIKPNEFSDVISNHISDVNKYKKIHIFGDIHACYSPLKKYFDKNKVNDDELYIFTGDYFDRGLENIKVFEFIKENIKKDNFIFLMGNHEDKLYKYANDDKYKPDYNIIKTIEEFDGNVKKSEIRGLIKGLSQIRHITYNEKEYIITHGGILYFPDKPLEFFSSNTYIYGSLDYDTNIDKLYDDYMKKCKHKVYQIHGHRNKHNIKADEYEYSINLDGNVEYGGNLRVLTIDKNGQNIEEIKNDCFDKDLEEKEKVFELVRTMRNSKYINEKELTEDISSFNFTKDAFFKKTWNKLTTKARGLFIDIKDYFIVARSYNKFFNVDEREEVTKEKIIDANYPAYFYLKYNGFLGILSTYKGELLFATKSRIDGPYKDYFKNIFYEIFNEKQINAIKKRLIKNNSSMVFEVIDHINDKHIIKYTENKLVLLDEIYNKVEFSVVPYSDLKKFADKNKIFIKKLVYTAENKEEFKTIFNLIMSDDYKLDNEYVEGFVLNDSKGRMVKYKTNYYNKWKQLRSKMEHAIKNNNFKTKAKDELETKFMNYLEEKYKDKNVNIDDINIIDERDLFLKSKEVDKNK